MVHPTGSVVDFAALSSVDDGGRGPASTPLVGPAVRHRASDRPQPRRATPRSPPHRGRAADAIAARFDAALDARDVDGCVAAILDLEQTLLDWSADTLTSDEGDHARAHLHRMVLRLGELATNGARDPREVDRRLRRRDLLELRRRARDAQGLRHLGLDPGPAGRRRRRGPRHPRRPPMGPLALADHEVQPGSSTPSMKGLKFMIIGGLISVAGPVHGPATPGRDGRRQARPRDTADEGWPVGGPVW